VFAVSLNVCYWNEFVTSNWKLWKAAVNPRRRTTFSYINHLFIFSFGSNTFLGRSSEVFIYSPSPTFILSPKHYDLFYSGECFFFGPKISYISGFSFRRSTFNYDMLHYYHTASASNLHAAEERWNLPKYRLDCDSVRIIPLRPQIWMQPKNV
jgi:hypothetical protein